MELRDLLYSEKNLIMIFFIVFSISLVAYGFRSEILENKILVSFFYLPLLCYAALYLKGRKLEILNYFLNSLYILSFFVILFTRDIILVKYSLILFVVPLILLSYIATEEMFDLKYFSRIFISVLAFFVISLFLLGDKHSIYVILILAINASVLTYFLFEIVSHNFFKRSAKIEEQ